MKTICYVFMVLPLVLSSCHQEKDSSSQLPGPVKVKTIQTASSVLSEKGTFSGTVEEASNTSLSFPVMGTVKKLHVRLGDHVRKGTLIATVDSASMQSSYSAAKSSLEQAEDAYRRMKELHDKGSLAEVKWVEIQSKVQQARSMEEIARKNLEDCKLYAPYSGVIAEKVAEVGQNVVPGMPVVKLVTAEQLNVKIAVPETEIAGIALRQRATIKVPALGGKLFVGDVTEKGIVANPLSRSYDVKICVKNTGEDLMPGMVAEVTLTQEDNAASHILPANVVQLDERNRSFVWVKENGKATKRIITCGEFTAQGITVISGLEEGDEVIVEGQQKVCEGTPVTL
ncbi:efflux RND transporter periplasmic adaptor subunit [Parabacteroides sp. AM08-6]|uniref:efflux RND transporter periplasmic adaptor subunit n=1 Tax=Parabacteroides sp. AM08-6 TaxID=2292053 RepID=UPI000F0087BD|nr:efflux RND transporter periplasmic adaptor subunit [Parabacteroides sp. AM08-6]RHJ86757.1 efflux RND transporter periplasmic adaptor subunit [Parabacteroides sp. AM08-6]